MSLRKTIVVAVVALSAAAFLGTSAHAASGSSGRCTPLGVVRSHFGWKRGFAETTDVGGI
ncbi:MAG: hypothetical protein CM1200mP41_05200 [Gammaproteobacteria bacterium]|nr:MAG: hypothetical protein CM1200mP41_05200 [Gammaproteobacteria bacterium]